MDSGEESCTQRDEFIRLLYSVPDDRLEEIVKSLALKVSEVVQQRSVELKKEESQKAL